MNSEDDYKDHLRYLFNRIDHFYNLIENSRDEFDVDKFETIIRDIRIEINDAKAEFPEYEI